MPEAKCYPGMSWGSPAVAGYPIGIYLPEDKLLEGGGFGWSGKAWLVCPLNDGHKAEIQVKLYSSDDPPGTVATWTPAAVSGKLPRHAPCMDRVGTVTDHEIIEGAQIEYPNAETAETWTIVLEPDPSRTHDLGGGTAEPYVVVDVHIVGPPDSQGFPPVGHS